MRFARAFLPAALAVLGCSHGQEPFQLSDVERLTVGTSTREEVVRVLGAPESSSPGSTVHESWTSTALPGPPLSFIVWPIYRGRRSHRCTVTAWYDARSVLAEGTVKLDASSFDEVVLFFVSTGVEYSLEERLLEPLRRAEGRGFKVQIAEGDRHRSLRRFLEERGVPR